MDKEATLKQLQEKNEKLTKLQSAKSDLISISAHQIRTSLSAIKWIVRMFINGDVGKLTAEQENLMKKAYEDNDRAINTVTELLMDNKREDLLEKKYSFEAINLIELVDDTIFDFSGEAHARKVEVIFLRPENLPKVTVDKEKMLIVLQNLIENAIKYSNQNEKVFIALREKDGAVEISIKNNGTPISGKGKPKIFQKFYREPDAIKKEAVGSGIGLFTAKQVVEAHHGKIWFESDWDKGTTFFVTIPCKK